MALSSMCKRRPVKDYDDGDEDIGNKSLVTSVCVRQLIRRSQSQSRGASRWWWPFHVAHLTIVKHAACP